MVSSEKKRRDGGSAAAARVLERDEWRPAWRGNAAVIKREAAGAAIVGVPDCGFSTSWTSRHGRGVLWHGFVRGGAELHRADLDFLEPGAGMLYTCVHVTA